MKKLLLSTAVLVRSGEHAGLSGNDFNQRKSKESRALCLKRKSNNQTLPLDATPLIVQLNILRHGAPNPAPTSI
jgi:hypothetical protein